MTANREIVRDALTALFSTALVGTGLPCQEVVGYKKSKIEKAPLVCILSAGSRRQFDAVGSIQTVFMFAVVVFVPDANAEAGWTENNVEDRLDWIERLIADVVDTNRNRRADYWENLDFTGEASQVQDIDLSGALYATEVHMLEVTVLE